MLLLLVDELHVFGIHSQVEQEGRDPDVGEGRVGHEELVFLLIVGDNRRVVRAAEAIDVEGVEVDDDGDLLLEAVTDDGPEVVLILDLVSTILLNIVFAIQFLVILV